MNKKTVKADNFKEILKERITDAMYGEYAKKISQASLREFWTVLARTLMELIGPSWEKTSETYPEGPCAHYFSAEFLVGRSMLNNLVNLKVYDQVKEAAADLGFDLCEVLEEETDPGLGNGGLGRLAACFLDSCATLNLPVRGYGILYRYGLFKQSIENGFQKEYPDSWMELPYPFTVRREDDKCLIHYSDRDVWAVPYDLPILGYDTDNINTIRLWKPESYEQFDFNLFNSQRFDDAVIERNRVTDIYRVLYPNDTSYDGKVLRVRQQYFFVSASLQSIIKQYEAVHGKDLANFSGFNKIQLNDTHPALAIPELMRILLDEKGLSWDAAWKICSETFAYTNHTTLAEALEKWDVSIFHYLFPRIMEIIGEIDRRFRIEMREKGLSSEEIEYLAPIHDSKVHMAWMACYASFSINGVAEIHTQILKDDTLRDFHRLYPERFSCKTNGITPRRWLKVSNPKLADLLTELLGSESWLTDLKQLEKLMPYGKDASVRDRLDKIRKERKVILADYVKKRNGIILNPDMIFDVQVKRLHEYKRQLLNALTTLDLYFRLKDDPDLDFPPVCFIFGAKAAPGYFRAKAIIKFINEVANMINHDPICKDKLSMHFLPNFNVTLAEQIFPASDISEQISTAGKEASGTGNMKFMLNGAITLGTKDGANIEILEQVGEENCFMFGPDPADFPATLDFYNSRWQYENIPGLKRAIDALVDGTLDDAGTGMFRDIYNGLLQGSSWSKADVFYVLGDFADYRKRREDIHEAYTKREEWLTMSWVNICKSGKFSSDRTISEYAKDIWQIKARKI